jgi:hypothetical protein
MEKRFLHTLQYMDNPMGYLVAGVAWRGYEFSSGDQLSRSIDGKDAHLTVESYAYGDGGYEWQYFWKISDTFTFSHRGKADSLEQACADAIAYSPEEMTFEYLGRSYVLYGQSRPDGRSSWEANIDGDVAEFGGPFKHGNAPEYWRWGRSCASAKAVFALVDQSKLSGTRSTLRDAIIAAIDAPELF